MLEVPIVGTFIGKDRNKTVPQNLEDYARIWPPIVKFAKEHGVKDRDRELPHALLVRRMAAAITLQHACYLAQDVGDHS